MAPELIQQGDTEQPPQDPAAVSPLQQLFEGRPIWSPSMLSVALGSTPPLAALASLAYRFKTGGLSDYKLATPTPANPLHTIPPPSILTDYFSNKLVKAKGSEPKQGGVSQSKGE